LQQVADRIKAGDRSQDSLRRKQQLDKVLEEPHIAIRDLQKITAPTLVVGADFDESIPVSHTLEIFTGLPHAQLFIMPGATHGMIRGEPAELYNSIVARFLDRPFVDLK
jgi:pimeloyl-ACP methyl ester carboxylesterase